MDDRRLERLGLLGGGLLFTVLALVSAFVAGTPPDPRDGPGKIEHYFVDHADELRVSAFVTLLTVVVGLVWLGFYWRAMRRAEGDAPTFTVIGTVGFVVAGVLISVAMSISAVTVIGTAALDPVATKFFFNMVYALSAASAIGLAVLAAATGAIALRTKVLPTWNALAGLAIAVVLMVGALGVVTTNNTIAVIGFIGFLLWLAWFVVASALLARGASTTS